jgi:Holliday junction DNA helicase RuvB
LADRISEQPIAALIGPEPGSPRGVRAIPSWADQMTETAPREKASRETASRETASRIQTPYLLAEDELDRSLRPRRLEAFVGQEVLREQLAVAIEASRARGDALDHVLLAGPPGLGKTSLAQIVAVELEVPFVQTAGPALERKGDIAAFLSALEPRSVFFVDEIHRLARTLEETLYPAMEDRRLPITVGQGAGARVVTLELPPFTLVGATTRTGLLTTPLRDRFGIQAHLGPYSVEELAIIVERSAAILEIDLDDDGARAIAARSRGTPRVANRLLKRVRDFAEVRMEGVVTARAAQAALELLEVDERGLDRLDRGILSAICAKFDGGPVGLSTLAVAVGEEQDTIEDVYEPYLLKEGLIKRTPRGRLATPAAFAHLGLELPRSVGHSLF